MSFDDTLRIIGEFGPYQRMVFFLTCLPVIFVGISDVNNAFILYTPSHRCAGYHNLTLFSDNKTTTNEKNGIEAQNSLSPCFEYSSNNSNAVEDFNTVPCTSWIYDESVFSQTLVSEHDLVCGDSNIPVYMQMAMYFGSFTGAIVQGIFAHRFGRKRSGSINLPIALVSGILASQFSNIYIFTFLRFLQVMACTGIEISSFVLAIELVGPSKRRWTGFTYNYFYSGGVVLLTGLGYWLRHWKYILIASSAPVALCTIIWWIVIPESPRWLISRGETKEALKVVMKIAKWNKTENKVPKEENFTEQRVSVLTNDNIKEFCSNCSLVCNSVIIFFNYFVVFLCYYGFTFNIENLHGNFYLNFFITGLLDFPGVTISLLFGDKIGRKRLYISGMIIAGISLLGSVITDFLLFEGSITLSIVFAMVGKTGIMVGFSIMYVWSAEVFPTVMRNSGMSIATACGNIGFISAPYVVKVGNIVLGRIGKAVPFIILSGLALTASLLTLRVPETRKEKLPETVLHARNMNTKQPTNA